MSDHTQIDRKELDRYIEQDPPDDEPDEFDLLIMKLREKGLLVRDTSGNRSHYGSLNDTFHFADPDGDEFVFHCTFRKITYDKEEEQKKGMV